jgi:hypothetical protein
MVTKRVLIAIRGGSEEGKKMGGEGRGKTLWSPKGFRSPHMCGNRKPFDCHAIMATENFQLPSHVATENLSITTCDGDRKVFNCHSCMVTKFGRHLIALTKFNHH